MERIKIYVDGSAINNENPNIPSLGGVAIFFVGDSRYLQSPRGFSGRIVDHSIKGIYWGGNSYGNSLDLEKTTNNTAELSAIWMVYSVLMQRRNAGYPYTGLKFEILGDSMYAGNLIFGDWKPKHNKKLVQRIKTDFVDSKIDITWKYVKAHDTDENNNYVDYLARSAAYGVETPSDFDQWKKEQI